MAKKNTDKKEKPTIKKQIISAVILVLSLLLFFSVIQDIQKIDADYKYMQESNMNIFKFIKLDFPEVQNWIGPFGAFFGYWMIRIFGHFFSISLILSAFFIAFFYLFKMDDENFVSKILAFIFFAFSSNIVFYAINPNIQSHIGIVPRTIYDFFVNIFDRVGTILILSFVVVTMLIIIFELENSRKQ